MMMIDVIGDILQGFSYGFLTLALPINDHRGLVNLCGWETAVLAPDQRQNASLAVWLASQNQLLLENL
jgi:hypothetical protein